VNNISLSGRLTRDPELRSLPSGDAICQMRLAVDNMAPGRKTGYIDAVCFGNPGEAAAGTDQGVAGRRRRPSGAPHLGGQGRSQARGLPGHRQRRVLRPAAHNRRGGSV
jgi:Single-strand binding protein family